MENKERLIVYDNTKSQDIIDNPYSTEFEDIHAFIVNNWIASEADVLRVKNLGVSNVYQSFKMYDTTQQERIDIIRQAKTNGCTGIVIDCEAYGDSDFWNDMSKPEAREDGEELRNICREDIDIDRIMLCEPLNDDQYDKYRYFAEKFLPDQLILEKTYQLWQLSRMVEELWRNNYLPGEKVIGIWQDAMNWLTRPLQFKSALSLSNKVFYYSENKLI